jgi:hypothetical protein
MRTTSRSDLFNADTVTPHRLMLGAPVPHGTRRTGLEAAAKGTHMKFSALAGRGGMGDSGGREEDIAAPCRNVFL